MKTTGISIESHGERRRARLEALLSWLELPVLTVFTVVLVFSFVLRLVQVNGASMQKTLWTGDRLVMTELFYTPADGDIVVVRADVLSINLIKRVIGTAGQDVVIDYNTSTVTVDGEVLSEDYLFEPMEDRDDFDRSFCIAAGVYEYHVPADCVFVLGDNRNDSNDSRMIGFLSEDDVLGHAVYRMKSIDAQTGFVK
ncbi:MAG: signal peptidase I [Oscillospiraceae bacterium]